MFQAGRELGGFILACESQKTLYGLFSLTRTLPSFRRRFRTLSFYQSNREGNALRLCWSSSPDEARKSANAERLQNDLSERPQAAFFRSARGNQREILFPLFVKERQLGLLVLEAFRPRQLTRGEESILLPILTVLKNHIYLHNLFRLVVRDELTGLFNKRSFLTDLRKKKPDELYSLAAIDIDKFKHYNDNYGHQSGDHILRSLGALLLKMEKTEGYRAYRYGGEEIMLIFCGIGAEESGRRMEKIRQAVQAAYFSTGDWFLKLTLSSGISDSTQGPSALGIVERADHALYESKANGRNRVTVFTTE